MCRTGANMWLSMLCSQLCQTQVGQDAYVMTTALMFRPHNEPD